MNQRKHTPVGMDLQNITDKFLTCVSCKELFNAEDRNPHLLACLHCICSVCLKESVDIKQNTTITCQLCTETHDYKGKLPPKDRSKYGFLKLIQIKDSKLDLKCQECEHQPAAYFRCTKCHINLCDDCHKHHKRAKRSHVTKSLRELQGTLEIAKELTSVGKCQVIGHESEELTFYCNKEGCKIPICCRCALIRHKEIEGHVILGMYDVYRKKRNELLLEKDKVKNKVNQIDKAIEAIETEISHLEQTSDAMIEEINDDFEDGVKALRCREEDICKEVHQLTKQNTGILEEQKLRLQKQTFALKDASDFLDYSKYSEDVSGMLLIDSVIDSRLTSLNCQPVDTAPQVQTFLKFSTVESELRFENILTNLGKIKTTSIYIPKTEIKFPDVVFVREDVTITICFHNYNGDRVRSNEMEVSLNIFDEKRNLVESDLLLQQRTDGTWTYSFKTETPGTFEAEIYVSGRRLDEFITFRVESREAFASAQVPAQVYTKD